MKAAAQPLYMGCIEEGEVSEAKAFTGPGA